MKVAFICDSTLQVNEEFCKKYPVTIVPLEVRLNEEVYEDNVTLKPSEFYKGLKEGKKPSTSQPSIGKVAEVYERLKKEGYRQLICFTLSKKLSGTNNSFVGASELVEDLDIKIIDTNQVARIAGNAVEKLIKEFFDGEVTVNNIEEKYRELEDKQNVLVTVENMDYLYAGGRLTKTQLVLSNLLSILPIITLNNGLIEVCDKHRTLKKVLAKMCEEVAKKNPKKLVILHATNEDLLEKMESLVKEKFPNITDVEKIMVSPVLGSHTGPNVIALGYYSYDF